MSFCAAGADDDQMNRAAHSRAKELGLNEEETYVLLERLYDDGLIARDEPARRADGKIYYYWVTRVTEQGVRKLNTYRPSD